MFGRFTSDTDKSQDEDPAILPHQVTQMVIEKKVGIANQRIDDLNVRYDWSVYKLPQEPSLGQLREVDEDLGRLYDKVSSDTSSEETERRMIIDCRQALQDLLGFYKPYDQISKPVDIEQTEEKDGGVADVSM